MSTTETTLSPRQHMSLARELFKPVIERVVTLAQGNFNQALEGMRVIGNKLAQALVSSSAVPLVLEQELTEPERKILRGGNFPISLLKDGKLDTSKSAAFIKFVAHPTPSAQSVMALACSMAEKLFVVPTKLFCLPLVQIPSLFEANLGLEQLKTISPVRNYDSLQYPTHCLNDLLNYALEHPEADFMLAANRWLELQRSVT